MAIVRPCLALDPRDRPVMGDVVWGLKRVARVGYPVGA
jgi:hypothetical protein